MFNLGQHVSFLRMLFDSGEIDLVLPASLNFLGFLNLSDSPSPLQFLFLLEFLGDSLCCKYHLDSSCPLNELILLEQLLKLDLLWHLADDHVIGLEPPPGFTPVHAVILVFERLLVLIPQFW